MSDINNNCPLCGKEKQEDETFCSECQDIAKKAYPEELLSNIEEENNNALLVEDPVSHKPDEHTTSDEEEKIDNNRPVKSNKKTFIFLFIGLVLMVTIGGVGSYVFVQNKNAEETEIAYWNRCIEENTPLGYAKYLVQYPEGKYSSEAHGKILELRENERKEWQTLRNSKNIDKLFTFLTDHPETPYTREIKQVIDSLAWVQTLEQNTVNGYQAYIDNVKLNRYIGEYLNEAEQKYDYLSQLKVVEGEELKEVKSVLSDFFKSLSSLDSKKVQAVTVPFLSRFYEATDVPNTSLTDSLKANMKINKVRSIQYIPNLDSPEVIKDNKGIYIITGLVVKEEKTFNDRKKKKESSDSILNIELNDGLLIRSLEEKED